MWANPFKPGDHTREQCVELYREYIRKRLEEEPSLRQELAKLRGMRLGCWCKPESCHGDVLAELADGLED